MPLAAPLQSPQGKRAHAESDGKKDNDVDAQLYSTTICLCCGIELPSEAIYRNSCGRSVAGAAGLPSDTSTPSTIPACFPSPPQPDSSSVVDGLLDSPWSELAKVVADQDTEMFTTC